MRLALTKKPVNELALLCTKSCLCCERSVETKWTASTGNQSCRVLSLWFPSVTRLPEVNGSFERCKCCVSQKMTAWLIARSVGWLIGWLVMCGSNTGPTDCTHAIHNQPSHNEQCKASAHTTEQQRVHNRNDWQGFHTIVLEWWVYLWWSFCTLSLLACQVRVTVGGSGLRCCFFWALIDSLVCWFSSSSEVWEWATSHSARMITVASGTIHGRLSVKCKATNLSPHPPPPPSSSFSMPL